MVGLGYRARGGVGYGNLKRSGSGGRFGRGSRRGFVDGYAGAGYPLGLVDYGYRADLADEDRQAALMACVRSEGFGATVLRLETLAGATGVPEIDRVIQGDVDWLRSGEAQLP